MADDLELALELAELADGITLERFRAADLKVDTKPDLTPVSEADRAVERALRERLAAARPGDGVAGEEYGADADAERRWIVDPIDGTSNYVRGNPIWATLIALEQDGEIIAGVASAPALGRRWWAARGAGAFSSDGRRLRVSAVSGLGDAQLLWSGVEDWAGVGRLDALVGLASNCWRSRGLGDFWQYMLVAEGAAEIALDPVVAVWDLAAPKVIVEEAGGRFTDLAGLPTAEGGDAIATNGALHDAVLAIVGRS